MKYDTEELALTLKELRAQRGLSQRDVAEKIGISQGKYFRIENNEAKLEEKEINAISKLMKVPIRILLNYGNYKQKLSFGHLQEETLQLILAPENADYLEEALINIKIKELEEKRARLHIKVDQKKEELKSEECFGILVRHVTKMFDEEVGGTDLETIQEAIKLVKELQIDGGFYMAALWQTIEALEELIKCKSNCEEPIDPEELLIDADNCISLLREL